MKDPLAEVTVAETRRAATVFLVAFVAAVVVLAIAVPGSRVPLGIVFGLVLMVVLHEAGHFVAARWAGMKATEFFVGFGRPKLWSFRRGETEFGVKPIVLGGYVKIIGMTNLDQVAPEDEPRAFRQSTFGKRLVVVLAGVTTNLLLAFVLFFSVIAWEGHSLTAEPSTKLHAVVAGSAADEAGLQKDDRIVSIDGRPIGSWQMLKTAIESHPGETVTIEVMRHGKQLALEATPRVKQGAGFLGIQPGLAYESVSVLGAVPQSLSFMGKATEGTVTALGRAFSPNRVAEYEKDLSAPAPKGSTRDLERPRTIVGIIDLGSQLVSTFGELLVLLGGISLLLALFNLVPLLPFDGGHAAVVLYEWIASKIAHRRVRVDYRRLMPIAMAVVGVLLVFFVSTLILDIRDVASSR